ncbi:MAG: Histidine kinase [Candidatus Hydrogenedentes bacterium]|nr:Histidine kinase [Candidatus Hydrogenedentota bacterium]
MADTAPTYPRIRWRDSLIVRVIVLCAVLVLCLLGSVVVVTRHYFSEVVTEMEQSAAAVGQAVELQFQENPDIPLDEVQQDMMDLYAEKGFDKIELKPFETGAPIGSFMFERGEQGELYRAAHVLLRLNDGREVLLTLRVSSMPQTEIVRAFKNKYLAALAALFFVTLGLMIYFIARMLRPLTELSATCAEIGGGKLQDVAVRRNAGEIRALEQTFNQMVGALREKQIVEANLRRAQRLSALGNLAAGVAHDVRNPLNTIKLLAGHAADSLDGSGANAAAVRQMNTIRKEVGRIEDIVSGFLSLAKERELKPEPRKIDELLGECVNLLKKEAETRKGSLNAELRAGDTTLMLDPKQWTRAILNVLINALEACREGGRVRLFSRVTGADCEIEIRDDGIGLSPEAVERVFEPYYTTKDTGTGLGLAITLGSVEEHGGTIRLSAEEGEGCQVLIVLPLEQKGL